MKRKTDHILELPKPHSDIQRQIMQAMFTPGLLEMWVPCGTKFGKTLAASSGITGKAWVKRGGLYRWVAPIYSQAKIGFKYCQRLLPGDPHVEPNKSDPSLSIAAMDSKIEFRSGQHPENLEGEACNGYVNDECAKMDEQVYDSEKTTLTITRGPMLNISTPRGKNWFYTKCMQAKDEMEWALKNGKQPTRIFLTAPSIANPYVTKEAVDDARRNLPERLFRQYYLAEFVDDGSVFSGFKDCLFGDPIDTGESESQLWYDTNSSERTVVIGADWAKTHDRTVFTAIDINTRRMCGFQRFYKTPYTEAIRRLGVFAKKFGEVLIINHDKTGLGTVIDDQLAYLALPTHGVTFTNATKADMVTKLITNIEHKMLGLVNWSDLVAEMDAYEVTTTATGLMSYSAPAGQHDDIVSSLMLSNLGLLQYSDRDMVVTFLEDKPAKKKPTEPQSPIEEFYNALAGDDDDD